MWKGLTPFKTSPFLEKAGHPLSTRSSLFHISGNHRFFFISFISVNSHSETNPGSLLKPDLPLVSAEFCQRRSAAPSAAQAANCIHEEQHKGIYTTEIPFCQLISNILDHCCTIQTHQQSGCRKHSAAAPGRAVIFTHFKHP